MRLACGDLSRWLERQAVLLTSTNLLAHAAFEQFAREQLDRGILSWNRPAIYSIEAWLAACWEEARYAVMDVPILLSPAQEHVLWRQVIEQDNVHLFDLDAAAFLAHGASQLIAKWHIPEEAAAWNDTEDARRFQHWHKQFRRRCSEQGWITRADLWRLVPQWLNTGICTTKETVFAGFHSVTPALARVIQSTGGHLGTTPARTIANVTLTECTDFEEELEQAARWARAQLEENPAQSIALFVPDLAQHQRLIKRIVHRVFYPAQAARPFAETSQAAFSIHASEPLSRLPVIASALLILELAREPIPLWVASAILRSPFIKGAEAERNERALADVRLHKLREIQVTLQNLAFASASCPKLQKILARVRRVVRAPNEARELSDWSKFFGNLLQAAGWPGDADLTAEEQEAVSAWQDALSRLASLSLISSAVKFDDALAHLRRFLRGGARPPNPLTPLHILDASDAACLAFDCACVVGMSEERWPPPLHLNPLVPLRLQRECGVPGSWTESAQEEKRRWTESLISTAAAIEVTYSGRLSPWVKSVIRISQQKARRWMGKLPLDCFTASSPESLDDACGPPLTIFGTVRGGTSLIKAQSQCPFRAFAEHRLCATVLEEAVLGLDSRERGTFLHQALQLVWKELGTLQRLRAASEEELRQIVQKALWAAVDRSAQTPLHQLAIETERERLEELILEWLAIERERSQNFTVEMAEEERYWEIAGMKLRLRVDRIDRLDTGNILLIDYKSGPQSAAALDEDRPREPQLLVYAAALGAEVEGIFLCQLKPRELKAAGYSREKQFADKSAIQVKDWDAFLQRSSARVEKLAREFAAGWAAIDPLRHACDHCKLGPMCRIRERDGIDGSEEID
jgi:ATP-dependent helicase/nuclease subunit B